MRHGLLFSLFCLIIVPLSTLHAEDAVTFPKAPLSIETPQKMIFFTVEVASTDKQQEHGLMFRSYLPDMQGMIFPFNPPRRVTFWMKNTPIALDMLFINRDGKISEIKENATPESTDPITSKGEIAAVLELKGGIAKRYHIVAGARVVYSRAP